MSCVAAAAAELEEKDAQEDYKKFMGDAKAQWSWRRRMPEDYDSAIHNPMSEVSEKQVRMKRDGEEDEKEHKDFHQR